MMYYLTDLNTMSDTSNAVFQLPSQLVASYAKEFCVPTQLANFAEGLWHLDHGSVEVCVHVLAYMPVCVCVSILQEISVNL